MNKLSQPILLTSITNVDTMTYRNVQLDLFGDNSDGFDCIDRGIAIYPQGTYSPAALSNGDMITFRTLNGDLLAIPSNLNLTDDQIAAVVSLEKLSSTEDYVFGSLPNLVYTVIKQDGSIKQRNQNGSIEITPAGDINISGAGNFVVNNNKLHIAAQAGELMEVLSNTLLAISQITVHGTPIDNAATFTSLQNTIDAMRI